MNSTVLIAENGTVFSWDVDETSVLTPVTLEASVADSRGGIPLCIPMFSTQQREVRGSHLPLHGILMYEPQGEITALCEGQRWEEVFSFGANESFAWKWSVGLQVVLEQNTLTCSLTITRDANCSNEAEMPYSIGFHPYFNTFGADFSYKIDGHTTCKQEVSKDITNSAFAPLVQDESATLTTSKGTLTITPQGYDEYCLWTDNINSYFCIEPIFQYREYGLIGTGLEKGGSHSSTVTLQFIPKIL